MNEFTTCEGIDSETPRFIRNTDYFVLVLPFLALLASALLVMWGTPDGDSDELIILAAVLIALAASATYFVVQKSRTGTYFFRKPGIFTVPSKCGYCHAGCSGKFCSEDCGRRYAEFMGTYSQNMKKNSAVLCVALAIIILSPSTGYPLLAIAGAAVLLAGFRFYPTPAPWLIRANGVEKALGRFRKLTRALFWLILIAVVFEVTLFVAFV